MDCPGFIGDVTIWGWESKDKWRRTLAFTTGDLNRSPTIGAAGRRFN
jgi:hypothetical protein